MNPAPFPITYHPSPFQQETNLMTDTPQTGPYGTWRSPITTDLITGKRVGVVSPRIDGDDVYWIENRPAEAGRSVVVRRGADGTIADAIPSGFNARTRVHEYGGGAYTVRDGALIFANFADTRLYRVDGDDRPRPITPEGALRYADVIFDPERARLIAVREDHSGDGEAVNTIVALDPDGDESGGMVLTSGADFYSNPRLSPDGRRLAWLQWNHPNMPWDGSELWVGEIGEDGTVTSSELIAGGPDESIFQPEWAPDGTLYFVSDRTGWWNLYRRTSDDGNEAVAPMEAEFGVPQWVFGQSTYGFASNDRIVCAYDQRGIWQLASLDTANGRFDPFETPFTAIGQVRVGGGKVVLVAGSEERRVGKECRSRWSPYH